MHMLYSRYGKQRLEAEMKALFGSSLSTWVLGRAAPLRPPARAFDARARARAHSLSPSIRGATVTHTLTIPCAATATAR